MNLITREDSQLLSQHLMRMMNSWCMKSCIVKPKQIKVIQLVGLFQNNISNHTFFIIFRYQCRFIQRNKFICAEGPPQPIFCVVYFHVLKNGSTTKNDQSGRQLQMTAYKPKNNGFLQAVKELEKFPNASDRVKTLQLSSGSLHTAALIVIGRLLSPAFQSFNLLMKIIGIWFFYPANIFVISCVRLTNVSERTKHCSSDSIIIGRIMAEKTPK